MANWLLVSSRKKSKKHLPRNVNKLKLEIRFSRVPMIPQLMLCYHPTGNSNPFQNLEKTSVLQEARTFNETPVNAKKCIHILTKILYLLNQVSSE